MVNDKSASIVTCGEFIEPCTLANVSYAITIILNAIFYEK